MSIIQRLMEKKQQEKSGQNTSPSKKHERGDRAARPRKELKNRKIKEPIQKPSINTNKPVSGQARSKHQMLFDFDDLEKQGFLIPSSSDSQLAEEYRRIKRPLLVNAFDEDSPSINNSNIMLVTSSLPNEGKTFTALNLAMSISMELDKTVLLVDADLQVAGLTNQLDLKGAAGLADVLNHEDVELSDIIHRTNVENLRVIPAGNRKPNSAELLASNDMQLLLYDLSSKYPDRVIIFDSPPLLARSESSFLAKQLGQVVVVVEAEQTPQSIVKEALEQLEECEIVNLVLNKRHNRPGMTYHGGYYGY